MKLIRHLERSSPLKKYHLPLDKLKLTLRLFYTSLAIFSAFYFMNISTKPLELTPNWLWPISWIQFFEAATALHILYFISILSPLLSAIFPRLTIFRALSFLILFQVMSAMYSFGKINHSFYGYLFSAFFFCFLTFNNQRGRDIKNKFFFWSAQASFLGLYFLSGIWKLRFFLNALDKTNWENINFLKDNLAWVIIESHGQSPLLDASFLPDSIMRILWLVVIFFELTVILAIWAVPIQRLVAALIILFHIFTFLTMNVAFWPAIAVAISLLLLRPYQKREI